MPFPKETNGMRVVVHRIARHCYFVNMIVEDAVTLLFSPPSEVKRTYVRVLESGMTISPWLPAYWNDTNGLASSKRLKSWRCSATSGS